MLIKRIIIFLLIFSMSFAFIACSNDEEELHIVGMSINTDGQLIVVWSNGETENLGLVGQDGVSVVSVSVNEQGELILELSDGSTVNAGTIVSPDDYDGTEGLVFSEVGEEGGYAYAVSGYIGTNPNVTIPETFKGKPVVSIMPYAFSNLGFNDSGCDFLKSVHIPAGVRNIGDAAFAFALGLETVTFADNSELVKIGEYAFLENYALTSILIPEGVTYIGDQAFHSARSLETIVFEDGDNIQHIGRLAFDQTPFLNTIEGAFILGEVYVYYGGAMGEDTELVIPNGITLILERVFENQENLISVLIPASVREIGSSSFASTTSLTTVTFEVGSQLESIGRDAFRNSKLENIEIPATVKHIGNRAFQQTTSLATVTFGAGSQLQTIGSQAFGNSALVSIHIPSGVQIIGSLAFDQTQSLTTVTFEAGSQLEIIGSDAFRNSALENIEIPASVKEIKYRAFQHTLSLTTVTFEAGSQLQSIGYSAFDNSAFTIIHIPGNVTCIEDRAFRSPLLVEIYIPLSVICMAEDAIESSAALTIYTEHSEKPSGWHVDWNPSNHDVVWGHSN